MLAILFHCALVAALVLIIGAAAALALASSIVATFGPDDLQAEGYTSESARVAVCWRLGGTSIVVFVLTAAHIAALVMR